jgi:hypothetical protein
MKVGQTYEEGGQKITVVEVGEGFVIEECFTRTEFWERGAMYGYKSVPPHFSTGWTEVMTMKDEVATWRRRREVPKTT